MQQPRRSDRASLMSHLWTGPHVCCLTPSDLEDLGQPPVAAAVIDAGAWPRGAWASRSVLNNLRRRVHRDGILLVRVADDEQRHALERAGFDELHELRPETLDWLDSRTGVVEATFPWRAARAVRTAATSRLGSPSPHARPPSRPATVAYVICVRDEAPRLPAFFDSLDGAARSSGCDRRFTFVLNGCTDGSENLIRSYVATTPSAQVISSAPGITEAFVAGINEHPEADLIGKLDADTTFDAETLDRLECAFGVAAPPRVAYAEPVSTDPPNPYAAAEQDAGAVSSRSYYVAKACLIDADVAREARTQSLMLGVGSDDIALSFVITLREGLDAIARAPGASVHSATHRTFQDLVRLQSRVDSALKRLMRLAPELAPLVDVFDQRIIDDSYARIAEAAGRLSSYTPHWLRLPSAKGQATTALAPVESEASA